MRTKLWTRVIVAFAASCHIPTFAARLDATLDASLIDAIHQGNMVSVGKLLGQGAYMRLVDQTRVKWQNRAHFFAVASQMIRRILVDYARGHGTAKRGGGAIKLQLDDALGVAGKTDLGRFSALACAHTKNLFPSVSNHYKWVSGERRL